MKEYLKNKYALSDLGAKDVMKSIISSTLINLSIMLPVLLSFIFLRQYINIFLGNFVIKEFTATHFILMIIISLVIMYFITKFDYKHSFIKIYDESARTRIRILVLL